ncbi:hypothetical protein NDK47_20380 [Brevibacillus ruminantium]|uniref:HTH merR-type domain-containing protein n=1 Tax=Brevibacillus ruminantium TaxID=2950604 RepID=A0ABY4WBD6_9BACL|nr:hypothetical protein [Brevibacillus ruminantium]USG64483.1 hypothetical protein NDK47_20380 [Brevibacillus ruminantium]
MKNVIELVAKEKTYSGRDVAEMLGIGASTLRKWSMLLEQQGYWFQRDAQNRREYRPADVIAMRRFFHLTKEQMMPLEDAALTVANQSSHQHARKESAASLSLAPVLPANNAPASNPALAENAAALALRTSSHVDHLEEKLQALAKHVQHQEAVQMSLMEQIEQQGTFIRNSLKERDRRLTKAMSDIISTKQELARLKDAQRKTSFWHRLFRFN